MAMLFGAFAVLALSLAAVGLYSVVSYTVAQRTNEFGIRIALRAHNAEISCAWCFVPPVSASAGNSRRHLAERRNETYHCGMGTRQFH